jgi:outer membrane immunogenic protein
MNRLLLSLAAGTAAVALSTSAFAADLPVYQAEPAYVAPVAYDWTGLYVGVQGGYGFGDSDGSLEPEGFLIGGTIGYNQQFDQFVAGIEADLAYSDIDDSTGFRGGADFDLDYLATVRGRLGYAWDRTLVFATGGLAFGETDVRVDGQGSDSDTAVGYVLGAGVEHAFTDNWSAKVEYNWVDLGDVEAPGGDVDFDAHIVKAGLNYKF